MKLILWILCQETLYQILVTIYTEKILNAAVETEHAVVLDRIKEEPCQATALQKLSTTMKKGNRKASKKNVHLASFYPIKDELYEAKTLVFRMERIVLPPKLQQKIIKSAHKVGHLRTTKTNQMLRAKYWFLDMNEMIDQLVGLCYDFQVTRQDRTQEHIKPPVKTMERNFYRLWRTLP